MKVGDGRQGKRRSGMLFSKDALSLCNSLAAFCLFSAHLRTAHRLACVSGGFLLCFFFCGSESKSYICAKAKPRQKQKTTSERGRAGEGSEKNRLQFFSLLSLLVPSPIVFYFVLGSSFVRLNLLLYVPPNKKTHQKAHQPRGLRIVLANAPSSRADQTDRFQIPPPCWPLYETENQVTDT